MSVLPDRDIPKLLSQYVETSLITDRTRELIKALTPNNLEALKILLKTGPILDKIYLQQTYHDNLKLLEQLKSQNNEALLKFFYINMGPFDVLDHHKPFIAGVSERPEGANFYPSDMTKKEFEEWISTLSEKEQKLAKGFYSIIVRKEGKLQVVPYAQAYENEVQELSKLLLSAADFVKDENKSLFTFLQKRAQAFISNEYQESDSAWVDVDSSSQLEITIGPYEVYADELFAYKSAFENFIGVRDFQETEKLKAFSGVLQLIEDNLPIQAQFKNPKVSGSSPIVVVDLLQTAGDRSGPQTAAFNLPNDEEVVKTKGSKMVLLRNVKATKFEKILIPISKIVIDPEQLQYVNFDAFFTHILAHEMLHGIGPHNIKVNDKESCVRDELKEVHSAYEEAKADITGLFALQFLINQGKIVDKNLEKHFYVTFLAGAFRSIRFGLNEAHGLGQAIILNFLLDEGGFEYSKETEKFRVNFEKVEKAVQNCVRLIMEIQATGDRPKALEIKKELGINRPETKLALEKLSAVPVDISPIPFQL